MIKLAGINQAIAIALFKAGKEGAKLSVSKTAKKDCSEKSTKKATDKRLLKKEQFLKTLHENKSK